MKYDNLVVGSGIAGITLAEKLASKGESVLLIDKREHIGGNCYDYFDEEGNYIQKYGPHAFHTTCKEVWDYLSKFTEWNDYQHEVLAYIKGKNVPVPFNLNSIGMCFNKKEAEQIKESLINEYGKEKKIPILELRKSSNNLVKKLADYVYENVFLNYTMKQWDLKPEDIDPSVTERVPVFVSRDNRYFQDKYQGMPKQGFTKMFEKMTDNPNIELKLNTDFKDIKNKINYERLFYTGPLDEFFDYEFGKVKYRKAKWIFEKHPVSNFQRKTQVNYPNNHEFTRITEFNKYLFSNNSSTVIAKEFPSWEEGNLAWPVQTDENQKVVDKYKYEIEKLKSTYFLGRLAESKYYNMDQAVKKALDLCRNL